jgi:DeoR family suf operon transcriptional repressor
MSYSWEFGNTPAGRVLKAILQRGKASIKDVASDLGVTASAVRLHLTQLQARGAIDAEKVREGVGRPHYVYSVTPEAHNLFYQDYGDLTRLLLQEVKETQGADALQNVLRRVGRRLADHYEDRMKGQKLADRIETWVELLEQRGVLVELEKGADGYVLREYGCPYQNVAVEDRSVCDMERQMMARLFGSGVRLIHCTWDGHPGCQFLVTDQSERVKDKKE